MTATWPDGTPKRTPGFRADVWAGEKPLTQPDTRPLEVGDWVEFNTPRDDNGQPTRKGVVVYVTVSEDTGEQEFFALLESSRFGVRRYFRSGPPTPASELDRARTIPRNPRTVAGFCARVLAQVAREHINGEPWASWDLRLLGYVQHLATLTDQQRSTAA